MSCVGGAGVLRRGSHTSRADAAGYGGVFPLAAKRSAPAAIDAIPNFFAAVANDGSVVHSLRRPTSADAHRCASIQPMPRRNIGAIHAAGMCILHAHVPDPGAVCEDDAIAPVSLGLLLVIAGRRSPSGSPISACPGLSASPPSNARSDGRRRMTSPAPLTVSSCAIVPSGRTALDPSPLPLACTNHIRARDSAAVERTGCCARVAPLKWRRTNATVAAVATIDRRVGKCRPMLCQNCVRRPLRTCSNIVIYMRICEHGSRRCDP